MALNRLANVCSLGNCLSVSTLGGELHVTFDLHNYIDVLDDEGRELSDLDAAKGFAQAEARQMVCASVKEHGHIDLQHRIEVRNERGLIVTVVKFEDAVRFLRKGEPV